MITITTRRRASVYKRFSQHAVHSDRNPAAVHLLQDAEFFRLRHSPMQRSKFLSRSDPFICSITGTQHCSSHMFSGFCQIYCTASDTLAVFRWITSWGTIQWACPTWSASAPSSQGAFTTVAHRSRPSRLCQGRSLAMRGSRHGSRQATRTRTSMSVLLLADLMGMTSSLITGGIPHTPSRQHTSTQRLWVPVLLLWGRTRCRGLWVTSRQ